MPSLVRLSRRATTYGGPYRIGNFKRIARCSRLSRTRVKCRTVSWSLGDVGWDGWVSVWYANDESGDVSWWYSLRIKRTNWYCVDRKRQGDPAYRGRRCSKVHRV